jgi:hypothetical protein
MEPAAATRPVFGNLSRYVFAAIAGGGTALGIASYAHGHTEEPDADGTSFNRIDTAEAKDLTSGPFAPTTILPLTTAFMAIGLMYTKGRITMPEKGAQIGQAIQDAAKAAGTDILAGEGTKTKKLYAFSGGMIFASFGARQIVWGADNYQTRHLPVDGNGKVMSGYGTDLKTATASN